MTTTIGSLDLNALNSLYSDSNQYFWFESNSSATYGAGAHVTLVPDTTFISNPTGQNILMNTNGFSVRNGLLPMMTLNNNSLDFNVVDATTGTYVTTATFSSTGSQIGQSDGSQSYMYLDYHSLRMVDPNGNPYLYVSDLRDTNGEYNATDTFTGSGTTSRFNLSMSYTSVISVTIDGVEQTENVDYTRSGAYSFIFTTAPEKNAKISISYVTKSTLAKAYTFGIRYPGSRVAPMSFAEGYNTTASDNEAHAEGYSSRAIGQFTHAENWLTLASGQASHAEGYNTTASGDASHAEGFNTTASGGASHAENWLTFAKGRASHAEGYNTTASGSNSHAQNLETIAQRKSQTALGEYNIADTGGTDGTTRGDYAVIIGNGTSDTARSNALTVDWNGNIIASGDVTNGSGNKLSDVANASNLTSGTLPVARLPVLFKTTTTKSSATSLNYNTGKTITVTAPEQSGYVLVGVVGVTTNHAFATSIGGFNVSSSTNRTINVSVTNRNTSASGNFTDLTVTVVCLWVRNNIY